MYLASCHPHSCCLVRMLGPVKVDAMGLSWVAARATRGKWRPDSPNVGPTLISIRIRVFCGECLPGYKLSGVTCARCSYEAWVQWMLVILLFFTIAFYVGINVYLSLKKRSATAGPLKVLLKQLINNFQIVCWFALGPQCGCDNYTHRFPFSEQLKFGVGARILLL